MSQSVSRLAATTEQQAAQLTEQPAEQLTAKALRQLFLTLFLRGRSGRGLSNWQRSAPRSVASKLRRTLVVYALLGSSALAFHSSVFMLSASLHAATFLLVGLFVASSAGEVLFNRDEADILLHRPVSPRALLWAKVRVMLEVSLWLAAALNLGALLVGALLAGGGWLFPIVHLLSLLLETLFCVSCVVLVYELCLRWFGRERLDALLTMTQVIVAVGAMMGGQVVPRVLRSMAGLSFSLDSWWLGLLPPVWFAAIDEALTGSSSNSSWLLAGLGLTVTATLAAVALGKLASDYGRGLQLLGEGAGRPTARAERRWFDRMVNSPPLSWWLRDSVTRAGFLLTAAYLVRDRDVKLRVYPALAPALAMPVVFVLQARDDGDWSSSFLVALAGSLLGLLPLSALSVLRFSQHWQATEIFRAAPIAGPAALLRGARRAILLVSTLPALLVLAGIFALLPVQARDLLQLLPGLLGMPVYPLFLCLKPSALPLSQPAEEARAAGSGLRLTGLMGVAVLISLLGIWAASEGWLWWFLLGEALLAALVYIRLRPRLLRVGWPPAE